MLQGLVTRLGAVPGLLPTPATLLHSPRKGSRSPGGAQEESRGRGSYEGTINGDIPWHGDTAWQGRGMGQHTWQGGGPP